MFSRAPPKASATRMSSRHRSSKRNLHPLQTPCKQTQLACSPDTVQEKALQMAGIRVWERSGKGETPQTGRYRTRQVPICITAPPKSQFSASRMKSPSPTRRRTSFALPQFVPNPSLAPLLGSFSARSYTTASSRHPSWFRRPSWFRHPSRPHRPSWFRRSSRSRRPSREPSSQHKPRRKNAKPDHAKRERAKPRHPQQSPQGPGIRNEPHRPPHPPLAAPSAQVPSRHCAKRLCENA